MSWEKIKLQDCCISISDGDHQSIPLADSGIAFIVISDIVNNRILFDKVRFVPEEYYDSLDDKRKPRKGDVLLTVKGTFGIPVYVNDDVPFVFQRDIAIFKCKNNINSRFLYYCFKHPMFYRYADLMAIGAAQRALTLGTLRNTTIVYPPLVIQKRIVEVLSAYDDLIENNQKQIKLLEEAAQRLYKEWFVNLRFPGHEDAEIVDGVPLGWKIEEVGKLIGKVPRTTQVLTANYHKTGKIPIIDQSKVFIAGYTDDETALVDLGEPVIVFGDHTRVLKYIQFPFAKGADGTQLIVSTNKNIPQSLLYCGLVNIDLSNYHYARHFKYLKAELLPVPTIEIAKQFDRYASVLFKRIQVLRDEIKSATEARDRLLPKLMSGEIEL